MTNDSQSDLEWSITVILVQQESSSPIASAAVVQSRSRYDPTVALPPKLVTCILNLEFVEMSELIPDTWHEDAHILLDMEKAQLCHCCHLLVMDIMTWLQSFVHMVAMISTKYLVNVPELWAYWSLIIQMARNYEGQAWVKYNHQYRREALARQVGLSLP